jgi:tRNA (guanine9-N1)-methyltransferase
MAGKEISKEELPLEEVASDRLFEAKDSNSAVTVCPQVELDSMYKQVQEEFDVFIKQYKFPDDITKSGKKKLIKKLQFDFFKPIKRKIEREKLKRKKASNPEPRPKRRKGNKLCDSKNKLRVAVDCSFDDLMSEKDIVKLSKQIQRCYSINRHMEDPLQLHLTNLQGKTLNRLDGYIDGYRNWDIHLKCESLIELFQPSEVVYLCAESENTLTTFDDEKIYVIGGFVDHNAHKGLAYERAKAAGFNHCRLPIDKFFTLATRKVLTVCHVFEIISNFCTSNSWTNAIENTIPGRKGLEILDDGTSFADDNTKSKKSETDISHSKSLDNNGFS